MKTERCSNCKELKEELAYYGHLSSLCEECVEKIKGRDWNKTKRKLK